MIDIQNEIKAGKNNGHLLVTCHQISVSSPSPFQREGLQAAPTALSGPLPAPPSPYHAHSHRDLGGDRQSSPVRSF